MSYLLVFMLLAIATIIVIVVDKWQDADFNERFPPINDEEFVRRYRNGINRDTALRVRRIISEQLGIEYGRVPSG